MEAAAASVTPITGYRFLLYRQGAANRGVTQLATDITDRVLRISPLDERVEETPGVAAVPELVLELAPDADLAPAGPFFGNRTGNDDVELRVEAQTSGGTATVFAGVLAADPAYVDACDECSLTLRFQGRLAALWDDEPLALERDGRALAWGHVGDDLLPALLAASAAPPPACDVKMPILRAATPFWTYFGKPADLVAGYEDTLPRGLAYDPGRGRVYVGVGPYVRSFDPARRVWETVARITYAGRDPRARAVTWRVAHLEYDDAGDRLLGIAESADDDVTAARNHLKAAFAIAL